MKALMTAILQIFEFADRGITGGHVKALFIVILIVWVGFGVIMSIEWYARLEAQMNKAYDEIGLIAPWGKPPK